ncbi:MAG: hypothetical protein HQ483_08220 [Rhodospirillales bacterium]|nr:hypothetical protein [Rhodospirillales bacterium]
MATSYHTFMRQLFLVMFLCGFVLTSPALALTSSSQIIIDDLCLVDDDASDDNDFAIASVDGVAVCRGGAAGKVLYDPLARPAQPGAPFNRYATGPPHHL